MKTLVPCLVVLSLLSGLATAQQPNSLTATLTVNGFNGPPFPIQASVQGNTTAMLQISGTATQPFILAQSDALVLPGLNVLGGQMHLELPSLEVLLDGWNVAPWLATLDQQGNWSNSFPVPNNLPSGFSRGVQAAVGDPASPFGATMSAGTTANWFPGATIVNLNLGDDNFQNVSLTPYGITLDFYGNSYNSIFVNSNGSTSFGAGDGDFTATAGEMNSGVPRISPFWTDLSPNVGGQVQLVIDQTNPGQDIVTTKFINVPDWNGGTVPPTHTFECTIQGAGVGDISMTWDPFNGPSIYDTVCGITPGGNLSPAPGNASQDLSMLKAQAVNNPPGLALTQREGMFEFFVGSASATPGNNFYDLAGIVLNWTPIGTVAFTDTYLFY